MPVQWYILLQNENKCILFFFQSELKVKYEMHISLHIKQQLYDNYKILKREINMS